MNSTNLVQKYRALLEGKSPWDNIFPLDSFDKEQLIILSKEFKISMIISADKNSLGIPVDLLALSNTDIEKISGNHLSESEIQQFIEFVVQTFYEVHNSHFTTNDIENFKSQIRTFFSKPYRFIRHEKDGRIVSYLMIGKQELHPYFKEPVWHLGYIGMIKDIDKQMKSPIKLSWTHLLKELNQECRVTAVIDYFNKSSIALAETAGLHKHGYRLSIRES